MTPLAGLLSKIPLRADATTVIGPPLFHAWGLLNWMMAMSLGSPIVLRRHFDPERVLAAVAEHRADTLVVVPVMLQRIVDLPEATRKRYDISTLRVIASSGSQLTPDMATRSREVFGDVVYNLYGSTEVAWATIATPEDLREAPGTAGRPPMGTTVHLYDDDDRPISRPGEVGRIFVGNEMAFEGYTGGGGKPTLDGLLATGDVGCFDENGRLFVRGRDDDMIVSGGENVFPQEVEDVLAGHSGVDDVAVLGVDDPEFGQRLVAVVVPHGGKDALTAEELQAFVKERLAGYKAPRDVFFVDELPRNATGKVLKRDLKARFA
jgi:fatty-acyl-CoA synthase